MKRHDILFTIFAVTLMSCIVYWVVLISEKRNPQYKINNPRKAIVTTYQTGRVREVDIIGHDIRGSFMKLYRPDSTTLYVSFCENEIEILEKW